MTDAAPASSPSAPMTVGEALRLALDHERDGRLEAAEALATAIADAVPDHADALGLLAALRLRRGADGGGALLARAIGHAGEDAPFFANLGSLLRRAGALDRAVAAQTRALALDPAFAAVWFNLGNARLSAAAVPAYARAVRLLPRHSEPARRLGEALLENGRPLDAAQALGAAVTLDPVSVPAWTALADALRALGRADGALGCLRGALALDPGSGAAWTTLGAILAEDGRHGGVAALRRAVRLRLDDAVARLALGEVLTREGGPDGLGTVRLALALRPGDRRSLELAGRALFAAGREDAAIRWHRRGVALDGGVPGRIATLRIHPAREASGESYRTVFPAQTVTIDTGTPRWGVVEYPLPDAFLTCVDEAVVHPGSFAVETPGGDLLLDGLHAYSQGSLDLMRACRTADGRVMTDLPLPFRRIEEEAVLLGGDGNFAHGVLDWASRLCVLERAPHLRDLPVLVSAALRPAVAELFTLLGVAPERLFRVAPGVPLSCRRLWVPSLTHPFQRMAPAHLAFLRERLGLPTSPCAAGRRLYLTRSAAGYRSLVNEAAVLECLTAEGFQPFVPDGLSMAEQIRVFAEAEAIVAPIGGGTAAVAFAPPGTAVVELTHQHCVLPQYAILCGLLGQPYGQIVGDALRNRGSLSFDWDFSVPLAQVSAMLHLLNVPKRTQ